MPRIQYVGHKSWYHGKHLMKILTNLKDFGVGRVVVRNINKKYPEPSFHVIKKVRPYMDDDNIWAKVWVDTYFRGTIGPRDELLDQAHLPDYALVPKDQEKALFDQITGEPNAVLMPSEMEFSPLLKMVVERNLAVRGIKQVPKMKLVYPQKKDEFPPTRPVMEGETPHLDPFSDKDPLKYERFRRGINF